MDPIIEDQPPSAEDLALLASLNKSMTVSSLKGLDSANRTEQLRSGLALNQMLQGATPPPQGIVHATHVQYPPAQAPQYQTTPTYPPYPQYNPLDLMEQMKALFLEKQNNERIIGLLNRLVDDVGYAIEVLEKNNEKPRRRTSKKTQA